MPFSPSIVRGHHHGSSSFSVTHFDLDSVDPGTSPIMLLDDFRVSGRPFGPHPHAGFSALTYVFDDSEGSLRSRDSIGNDLTVGPGGLVWFQSARGALHEETPEQFGRVLHGAQIYVNLRAENKKIAPQTFCLQRSEVPLWRDEAGSVVRVVVGRYREISSPLVPAEPFRMLDLSVNGDVELDLVPSHHTVLYARGPVSIELRGQSRKLGAGEVVAVTGETAAVVRGADDARLLVLSGPPIDEPRFISGPFMLNQQSDLEEVHALYRRGGMGVLNPRA